MRSMIVVHPKFEKVWPFVADHLHALWKNQGEVEFIRLEDEDHRKAGELIPKPESVVRLILLNVSVTVDCLNTLSNLKEVAFSYGYSGLRSDDCLEYLKQAGITLHDHPSEGYWSQSVSEFALALTICGLRRIPQTYHAMLTSHEPWNYDPPENKGRPGARGDQFGDDPNFVNGTVEGKRVRMIGAGNIASRYASFVHMMGADVAAWDPYASEPSFHRAGTRKEWHLDQLVKDAEIFVPMVPFTPSTKGIVTAELINALPKGCLVLLCTRAGICDIPALRKRVLADELSLAADVFDVEPLPLDDPLLGRHNVVHTPHNAGRTIEANRLWAEKLAVQFQPR